MFEPALSKRRYFVFHEQPDRPQPPSQTHAHARIYTHASTHTNTLGYTVPSQPHGEKGKLNENEVGGGEKEGEADLVQKKNHKGRSWKVSTE